MNHTLLIPVEEMKEGVIYRDRRQVAYVLNICRTCGKKRAVVFMKGKPQFDRCHDCAMRTPEKRLILSKAHKGIPISAETLRKRKEAYSQPDNYHKNPEWREKISSAGKGRIVSEETKRKLSIANKNQKHTPEQDIAHSIRMKKIMENKEIRDKYIKWLQLGRCNPKIESRRRQKIGKAARERWSNKEYRENTIRAIFRSSKIRPTKPEIALDKLLQDHFPHQWLYNGDFSNNVIIGGLIPDFINVNGQKKCIEMFGDYYHDPQKGKHVTYLRTEKGRLEKLREFGFDCLIIWEKEMKNTELVLSKIEAFNGR